MAVSVGTSKLAKRVAKSQGSEPKHRPKRNAKPASSSLPAKHHATVPLATEASTKPSRPRVTVKSGAPRKSKLAAPPPAPAPLPTAAVPVPASNPTPPGSGRTTLISAPTVPLLVPDVVFAAAEPVVFQECAPPLTPSATYPVTEPRLTLDHAPRRSSYQFTLPGPYDMSPPVIIPRPSGSYPQASSPVPSASSPPFAGSPLGGLFQHPMQGFWDDMPGFHPMNPRDSNMGGASNFSRPGSPPLMVSIPMGSPQSNFGSLCPICLRLFHDFPISTLTCGHQFHSYCIRQWLKINSTCPYCRSVVTPPTGSSSPILVSESNSPSTARALNMNLEGMAAQQRAGLADMRPMPPMGSLPTISYPTTVAPTPANTTTTNTTTPPTTTLPPPGPAITTTMPPHWSSAPISPAPTIDTTNPWSGAIPVSYQYTEPGASINFAEVSPLRHPSSSVTSSTYSHGTLPGLPPLTYSPQPYPLPPQPPSVPRIVTPMYQPPPASYIGPHQSRPPLMPEIPHLPYYLNYPQLYPGRPLFHPLGVHSAPNSLPHTPIPSLPSSCWPSPVPSPSVSVCPSVVPSTAPMVFSQPESPPTTLTWVVPNVRRWRLHSLPSDPGVFRQWA